MGAVVFGSAILFPEDTISRSIQFILLVALIGIAQIPFSMALSCAFHDSKVASQVGGLLIIFPVLLFMQLAQTTTDNKYILYALFFLPVMPTCTILTKLTSGSGMYSVIATSFFDVNWVSTPVCWVALVLNIPFWLLIYHYLDKVVPNEYGV